MLYDGEPEKTSVLEGFSTITKALIGFYSKVHSRCDGYAVTSGRPLMLQSHQIRKILFDLKRKGVRLRHITEITKDNIFYCKQTMESVELRHLDYVTGGLEVSDTEFMATANTQDSQITRRANPQVIHSNVKQLVQQQQNIFEVLWNKAIPADQKIREIEGGIKAARVDIIHSPAESMRQAYTLLTMARKEVMISIPTPNSIKHLISFDESKSKKMRGQKSTILDPNVHIRILISDDRRGDCKGDYLKSLFTDITGYTRPDIRILNNEITRNKIGILLVDRQRCLTFEVKDDTMDTPEDDIGLSTYSDSKAIVSSHVSIFESLWLQTEMYQQLKSYHRMQQEFMNTAAHELRTPIHPILMSAESLINSFPNEERISIILRNTERLRRLANDILEATRIESNTLNLKMQRVNLNETIKDIVMAFRIASLNDYDKKSVMINCEFNSQDYRGEKKKKAIFVRADKSKLLQVVSYLINNAIKFLEQRQGEKEATRPRKEQGILKKDDNETKIENAIWVSLERNDSQKEVTVNIKDTGTGIDPEILPRLFSKFVTKSFAGIGLGLYICKGIIEAHGGKIWAENNGEREKGATFSFTLPLDI